MLRSPFFISNEFHTNLYFQNLYLFQFSALNVEDINQNFYISEYIVSLTSKVVFHERFLTKEIEFV